MADVYDQQKRSALMASIRSQGNRSTELRLVELLRRSKIKGWRRHQDLPGRPDFIFRDQHVAIFVDGCFWHGCSRCRSIPSTRRRFWKDKISSNQRRDKVVAKQLRTDGWIVLRVWEHELKSEQVVAAKIQRSLALGARQCR